MNYTYEIWDKKSPINNVNADIIMEHHKLDQTAEVYLIKSGPRTLYIQTIYDSPYTAEGLTIEEIAQAHVNSLNNPE